MSQLLFAIAFSTVNSFVVPPEPNPVASDIVSRKCVPTANVNDGIVYEPLPLVKADAGTDIFWNVSIEGVKSIVNGACPPVHETVRPSH